MNVIVRHYLGQPVPRIRIFAMNNEDRAVVHVVHGVAGVGWWRGRCRDDQATRQQQAGLHGGDQRPQQNGQRQSAHDLTQPCGMLMTGGQGEADKGAQ
jgi:hypothetical protein